LISNLKHNLIERLELSGVSFSVKQILDWTGGRVVNAEEVGSRMDQIRVQRPASLGLAKSSDLAFFFSRIFEKELPTADPGILIIGEPFAGPLKQARLPFWTTSAVIACQDPYLAMAVLSEKFAAVLSTVSYVLDRTPTETKKSQIHPTAIIAPTVRLGEGVQIGPYCVIEDQAQIGRNTVIYAGCYIGPQCEIGENCVLFPKVTLYEWTQIGDRTRIHAGCSLGADGFGYAPKRSGSQPVGHQKIYHIGRVIIESDVEIGANCTVDRGTFGDTRIGKNAKLDNLVHVGHNARIEEGAVICGGTCLAGNAVLGKYVYVGGLSGITNHVHVGDGAKVGAMSLITGDVPPEGTAVGNPQREYREHFRAHALLSKLLRERRSK
jgi:UDP-3-O-[3-hydroxymyristoyl] glucosamine N-acyltransferase LpxD